MNKENITQKIAAILKKPFFRKFAGGILTQILLSCTNLLIKIWIARQLSKSDYGLYVVAFSTIFIFLSVQNALVNSPLTVLLPDKSDNKRKEFLSGLNFGQWFIFIPILFFIVCFTIIYGFITGDITKVLI